MSDFEGLEPRRRGQALLQQPVEVHAGTGVRILEPNPSPGLPRPMCLQPAPLERPSYAPVVVLVGARTFSAAEDFAMAFDALALGTLVGEATGGNTGQPFSFGLPGGGRARVRVKHDAYPDGREFIGVGIELDIQVRSTVEGVRAGRDEVLEAALREIERQKR